MLIVDQKAVVTALSFAAATPTNPLASINPGAVDVAQAESLTFSVFILTSSDRANVKPLLHKMI